MNWFANPNALWLLLSLPVLGLLAWFCRKRKQPALIRFAGLFGWSSHLSVRPMLRRLRGILIALALLLLILGMAGPQWGREKTLETASGRDVVICLDMSRSMLAEQPSRQLRSKQALLDLCTEFEKRGGHRLGLVVFAGRAAVVCPLTHDYYHFRRILMRQDAANLPRELRPPNDTGVSGTRIGLGLQAAARLHDPRFQGSQDILLLSDGDDPAGDREWQNGIHAARLRDIPVDVIGIGDPDLTSYIPLGKRFLLFGGEKVKTKMEEEPLREIARQTGGFYIPAQTKGLPLGDLYRDVMKSRRRQRSGQPSPFPVYRKRYQWFVGAALLFVVVAMSLTTGKLARRPAQANKKMDRPDGRVRQKWVGEGVFQKSVLSEPG